MAKDQDYILKKFVTAKDAAGALALDRETTVSEVHLIADTPKKDGNVSDAVGFHTVVPED